MSSTTEWINTQEPWVRAFLATALISLLPNIFLVLLPDPSSPTSSSSSSSKKETPSTKPKWSLTNLLLCFAVGALLGDVFLHALPHLLAHDHSHSGGEDAGNHKLLGYDRTLVVELTVLGGFLIFFIADKTAIYVLGEHSHSHGKGPQEGQGQPIAMCPFASANPGAPMPDSHPEVAQAHLLLQQKKADKPAAPNKLKAAGWLNLLADAMHNLTDGLAIGAAYAAGGGTGIAGATVLSVLFHELPHEIGDYTILVKNGLSKWQAIRMQFITAGAAFLGTALGLQTMNYKVLQTLLLSLTSGGFVYVAAVSVLPEVVHHRSTGKQLLAESAAFVAGVAMMAVMALLEEEH